MKNNDIFFEDIEELADYIVDEIENDDSKFIAVIAKFDEAKEVLKSIMAYDNVDFEIIQIESPEIDNYKDEFVVSVWSNNGIIEVGCEKLMGEDGDYLIPGGDIVFLFDDCSSKIIPLCEDSELYFVNIDCDCDCDGECDKHCCGCRDYDDIYEANIIYYPFGWFGF